MDSGSLDRAAVRIAERAEANRIYARALRDTRFRNILQRPESVLRHRFSAGSVDPGGLPEPRSDQSA